MHNTLFRFRLNMTHARQSRPDYGPDVQGKSHFEKEVFLSSLGSFGEALDCRSSRLQCLFSHEERATCGIQSVLRSLRFQHVSASHTHALTHTFSLSRSLFLSLSLTLTLILSSSDHGDSTHCRKRLRYDCCHVGMLNGAYIPSTNTTYMSLHDR